MAGFHIPGDPYFPNQGNAGWIDDEPEEDPEEDPEEEPEEEDEQEEEEEDDQEEDEDEEEEEEDTVFGGDKDDFQDVTFNPFHVQEESNDDAAATKGKFKSLIDKLDTLLESSKTSSSSQYSFDSVNALIKTFTKEHASTIQAFTKAVENCHRVVREMAEKVEKLLANATKFMEEFCSSSENNTATANKADNTEIACFVVSEIEKLQADLAIKNSIMDKLNIKTEKVKVLSAHPSHANAQVNELKSEGAIVKSVVVDENHYLQALVETRYSLLTVSVRKHLAKKLKLVFLMLNCLEGVLESESLLKQGGEVKRTTTSGSNKHETTNSPPKSKDSNVNVASGSKGKGKLIGEDDQEEQDDIYEEAQLQQRKSD
ncbi:unnamed protein product [Lactuca saligna]|uniref:Uncharacterized protein n=1 Tax=Lactuca saligna TaxID=75948 RepID=A0AA36EF38_LACSI|nr:unnamed protein product [Lactuca saligna]